MTETRETETIRKPLMSGHCAVGNKAGHERCQRNGGGQRANPQRQFQPCPCSCHFDPEAPVYECGGCSGLIIAAPDWPLDFSEDPEGEVRYTHVDLIVNDEGVVVGGTGRALGEECLVSRNTTTKEEKKRESRDCVRCGDEVDIVDSRICKRCIKVEADERAAAADAEDDFSDLDDEDDFSDLDDI